VSKNLSMDMDVSVDGRIVEIEDESCIGKEWWRSVGGAVSAGAKKCWADQFRVTQGIGSLGDVGKGGAESLKCN